MAESGLLGLSLFGGIPACCCLLAPVWETRPDSKWKGNTDPDSWSLFSFFSLPSSILIFGAPILLPPNMSREISSPGLKEYEISNSVSVWQNVTSGISGLNWALVWGALPSPYLISGLSLHQGPLTQELSPHWQPGQVSSHKTKCVRWSKEKCT